MNEKESTARSTVEQMPAPVRDSFVSDELNRIAGAVRSVCPPDSIVGFEFEKNLRINIDIRKLEDLSRVEGLLPSLCGGIFSKIERGLVDNHSFFHRLTALVYR